MNAGDLLDLFRDEMNDTGQPYLWADSLVLGYIDSACTEYCRRTHGLQDSTTSAVVNLDVVPGTDTYALHPAVLKIRQARRSDTGRSIDVLNVEDMPSQNMYFDGRQDVVKAVITGMDEGSVRIWPVPNETITVKLSVLRLPLVPVTARSSALEVPLKDQRQLLFWVKHLACLKQDAETYDKDTAEAMEARFLAHCAQVRQDQERLRHKPRAVMYGGI